MKILYFDVETTGISPIENDIVQLSGMLEVDGKVVETFNYRCQPFDYKTVSPEALQVTGLTIEEIKTYPIPGMVFLQFTEMLGKHVSKWDKLDKVYPAGYNVRFDLDFVQQWFKKNGDKYGFGVWQNWKAIDPLPIFHFLESCNQIKLPDYKLSTVCAHYGIEIQAHDALSDIKATKALIEKLRGHIAELPF